MPHRYGERHADPDDHHLPSILGDRWLGLAAGYRGSRLAAGAGTTVGLSVANVRPGAPIELVECGATRRVGRPRHRLGACPICVHLCSSVAAISSLGLLLFPEHLLVAD